MMATFITIKHALNSHLIAMMEIRQFIQENLIFVKMGLTKTVTDLTTSMTMMEMVPLMNYVVEMIAMIPEIGFVLPVQKLCII